MSVISTVAVAAPPLILGLTNHSRSASSSGATANSYSTASLPRGSPSKNHDYLLKFLLVGDSDVGKEEILGVLEEAASESPYQNSSLGVHYKTTTILMDGKRVKLQLWDTSGQGRFCTIIRSYSRGAQGILLVYDITNKWSFDGIDRWIKEIEEHAPGVPKILVGNRLHLAYKRQISEDEAEAYALKHSMAFFEVSSLCDFNIVESLTELSRLVLKRNGMDRLWRHHKVLSLQELCCRVIVNRTTMYSIEHLPLPTSLKSYLKSYSMTNQTRLRMQRYMTKNFDKHKRKILNPSESPSSCRKSCIIC
ncbi:PREDICTED: ras-related protein Rab-40B-like [Priapulus caudatus]|uniref:Ras-related protein Rab-40B-like n=1 Tax=Priapulus caudatus TaxID=37621 RepID=A0ABM1DU98_PRICU|nr:PREDICTED: ras-related protein Rab-40B-like [Priapulus caudatus]